MLSGWKEQSWKCLAALGGLFSSYSGCRSSTETSLCHTLSHQILEKIEKKPFSINILTVLKTVRKTGMVNGECRI